MMAQFDPELRAKVQALGRALNPDVLSQSQALYAPLQTTVTPDEAIIVRDARYGTHERHRLDILRRTAITPLPALVFVHGGGFVGGDKNRPGSPFYDNVAIWAARSGLVGVNMTYRLAPDHPWPAGAEDVAAAVDWLRRNANAHGVDPERIWVAGQSAGAAHVAAAFAQGLMAEAAGAILISGVYDLTLADPRTLSIPYYGADPSMFEARSSAKLLAAKDTPVLIATAEFDPRHFQKQSLALANAIFDARGALPRFYTMSGHNHITGILHLGLPGDHLGLEILDFIKTGQDKPRSEGRGQ